MTLTQKIDRYFFIPLASAFAIGATIALMYGAYLLNVQ